ncbi:MAG: CoA transferase, partial [Acidimicrobiaceae bacterium]|nr:CoA transferase [Acidimicrobiaceae bacterium]
MPLAGYRVLDLTDERGQLAGALLRSLGAEVILIEPAEGCRSRSLGPWSSGREGPRQSLSHWSYNRGKKSVVLDLASRPGRDELRRLAAGADVLIESGMPGELRSLGLGFDDLAAINPALVYVSITAFGQEGPKATWPASDLTVLASAMVLDITGDADRPPVRVSVPQGFLHAAADAATGALLALHERRSSGLGQFVDVSAQQSCLQATQSSVLSTPLRSSVPRRTAGGVRLGDLDVQLVWPCRDGHVSITFLFGAAIGPFTRRFMEWIHEEGGCDKSTCDKDWISYGVLLLTGQEPLEEYERVKRVVEEFTLTRTKAELLDAALHRRLLIAPVSTLDDLATSEQLAAREYWDFVDDPSLSAQPIRAPGPVARFSATPLARVGRPPRLGEHTESVLGEAGRRVAFEVAATETHRPALEGLKVLDLSWVMAGPAITRVLADYGATVVRIESATRTETARTIAPFLDNNPEPENSGLFFNMNAGKLNCAINLAKPEAREVIHDLVRWADVVAEAFSPRAMRGWELNYEALRKINPSLVMLSSCLMGQNGPLSAYAGFGNLGGAYAGFYDLAGWPDRGPAGPYGAYTDYVSPRYGLAALLAALDHRARTGEGQHIDLSQAEASMHFLGPAIVSHAVGGTTLGRPGNRDTDMAPHGVYPSEGEDEWVAIACQSDEQWKALCALLDRADLASEQGLTSAAGRLARADEVDAELARWTARHGAAEAAEQLRNEGIPAHAVQSSPGCFADPQLVHRGHFVEVDHELHGVVHVEG